MDTTDTDLPAPPEQEQRRAPVALATRGAEFRPSSYDAERHTIDLVWTTGARVLRRDWMTGERWMEELAVSADAIDLTRLNAGAPVLDTHYSGELRSVLGVVESAWVEGGVGMATVRFSSRADVAPIEADVAAGVIRNISVGYSVEQWADAGATPDGTPIRRATRWMPHEISLVPIPADAGAQVRAASGGHNGADPAAHIPEVRMDVVSNPGAQDAPINNDAAVRAAVEAERERGVQIRTAARVLGFEAEADQMVTDGLTVAQAQARMIEMTAARQRADGAPQTPRVTVLRDEGDTKRMALANALEARAGVSQLHDAAREFRGLRLSGLAREAIAIRGGNTRGMTDAEVALAALGNRDHMARAGIGAHSTSDFPNILANTASKAMALGYNQAPRTFTAFARRRTLPDFKSFRVVSMSDAPTLSTVLEGGEIEYGTVGEKAESYSLFRAGRRIGVTFETIVNDDMDAFSRLPTMFGASASRLESDTFYAILNSNPTMADGTAIFAAGHSNVFGNGVSGYSSGDGVLNVTGLSKGRALLRKQTAPQGAVLALDPRYLLVPAELEAAALQYTSASYVPAAQGNINPFTNVLTPIVEPRLSSAAQWYLICDPAVVDTLEYAYLEGMEAPQITSYTDPDTDGVVIKCTHSFGAKAIEYRGMARSSGT